jgi:hypothetical protein
LHGHYFFTFFVADRGVTLGMGIIPGTPVLGAICLNGGAGKKLLTSMGALLIGICPFGAGFVFFAI